MDKYIEIAVDLFKDILKQWDSIETVTVRIIDLFQAIIEKIA